MFAECPDPCHTSADSIMLDKNGANLNNPSRGHRQDGIVENSTAKMALTQGPSALRSRALRIIA